jgi:PAS domain S-box-containing protein
LDGRDADSDAAEDRSDLRGAARIGVWTLDLRRGEMSGTVLFNDRFRHGAAVAFDDSELEQTIHPDDRARWRVAYDQAIAAGTEYDAEYRVRRPDGTYAWLHVRAHVTRAADGTALQMSGVSLDVTERRQAELRFEVSEESLRLATDAAEVGTWDLDLDTDTLTWSDRTKAMFGISADVACSMADFYAGLHPDDFEHIRAAFASSIDPAVRATYDVEYRTVGKEDGVVRWVAAKGKGLFERGRCRRALGTAIDITARKLAVMRQVFLLELSDRLRAQAEPAAIADTAAAGLGRHLAANRVGFGFVQPDDRTVVLESCYVDGVERLTGPFDLESFGAHNIRRQRRGETVVYDDVASDPLNDPVLWDSIETRSFVSVPLIRGGRLVATLFVNYRQVHGWRREDIGLVADVAGRTWDALQRALAEAALRTANESLERLVADRTAALQANEARLRTIFETSYQLQGLLTPDGLLLEANATLMAAIEAKLEDVVGTPFWDTPLFTATPGLSEMIRGAVMTARLGERFRREISVQLPAGTRRYDFSLRPIRNESGEVVAIVPEAVDITGRRQAEEALRQAQKMEAVGHLTGGIAHDFNNLLTGIQGSLELVNKRIAAGRVAEVERFTLAAISAAGRAAALTQRLLAFARRQPLVPKRVEGNQLVAEMEDLLRRSLGPEIDLKMAFADGLWPTLCDPNQLENAILNLAINARDAMPDGGRLTIETLNSDLDPRDAASQAGEVKAGDYVCFVVSDTGSGMGPEVIARAFEPFFTTKPTGQGTGLGLSMLYGFVKQSEGHVRVESEPGHGTIFRLYLPRFDGSADPESDDPAERSATTARASGETVLVVDDEATVRLLVGETLSELGYLVLEAEDGASALRILQSAAKIDLLVTDVGLPVLNGRQLADGARVTRPGLRVLFMTGYAETVGGRRLEAGMDIITKPFSLDALSAKVRGMTGLK